MPDQPEEITNSLNRIYFPSNYLDLLQDEPVFAAGSNTQGMLWLLGAPEEAERSEEA